jgi:hypothetical protein
MKYKCFRILIAIKIGVCCFLMTLSATADTENPLTGTFYGTAHITEPATIATIDLVLYLDINGTTTQHDTSYIDVEKTLVFPVVAPQIDGKDVGPRVSGNLGISAFSLQSDEFDSTVGEISVTRQILLTGTKVENAGNSLSGTYTETVAGMGPDDITISGLFLLVKPAAMSGADIVDLNGDDCLDADEIRVGGSDSAVVEYGDVSQALHLYNHPEITPNLCSPAPDLVKQLVNEYYNTLNE